MADQDKAVDYLFVVSPGRSGSQYVSKLFLTCSCVQKEKLLFVEHEPMPVCCGKEMQDWNDGFYESMNSLVKEKKKKIDNQRRNGCYIETNPQFIKAFGLEWLKISSKEERAKIGIVKLNRDSSDIVNSFWANREAPGFDIFADVWNIKPGCVESHVPVNSILTPKDAIEWQNKEIDERWLIIQQLYPECNYYEISLHQLNILEEVMKLFSNFNLIPNEDKLKDIIGNPQNTGAERFHKHSEEIITFSNPLPEDPGKLSDLIEIAADYIIQKYGKESIMNTKRAILGMEDCISCMVGAKKAMNDLHDDICKLIGNIEIDFTDFRWNLTCQIVYLVDSNDSMFNFVTKIGRCRFILDGLNTLNTSSNYNLEKKNDISVKNQKYQICITGASGRIAGPLILKILTEFHIIINDSSIEIVLHLLVKNEEKKEKLIGLMMDIEDSIITPIFFSYKIFYDAKDAFNNSDMIILCASAPRYSHYERYHLAKHQESLYNTHAKLLKETKSSCQIIVVANPVVTIANYIISIVPSIAHRVTAAISIDTIRACKFLLNKSKELTNESLTIKGVQILGNHSGNLWVDCTNSKFINLSSNKEFTPRELFGEEFLLNSLQNHTRHRGREIIELSSHTASFSIVTGIMKHIKFILGKDKSIQSIGVFIDSNIKSQISKLTNIIIPDNVNCMILPCILKNNMVIPHIQSIKRAFCKKESIISFKNSVDELKLEIESVQSENSINELPIGSILQKRIDFVKEEIDKADYILIFAGAGMSVSSGIPDITNFKTAFPAMVERGIDSIFKASSHNHFVDNPDSAWGFWGARAKEYASAIPDKSYLQLLSLCNEKNNYFVCTSNIDRFFTRSGFSEDNILEIHGSIFDLQCINRDCIEPVIRKSHEYFLSDNIQVDREEWIVKDSSMIPKCNTCDKYLRIATELALDGHFMKDLVIKQKKNFKSFLDNINNSSSIVILEIGCGVVMSKLREKASRFTRIRNLAQKSGCVTGSTTHVRINTSHWEHNELTPLHSIVSLPLPIDILLNELCSK